MSVRLARVEDHPTLARVLGRAFDDDPIQRWAFPRAGIRARYGHRFFRWSLWRCAEQQVSWSSDDLAGAALWTLPDRWRVSTAQLLRLVRWAGMGVAWRGPLVMWGLSAVERAHPSDRHLYLAVLGVDPDRQGSGLGSALIAPGPELCDREGLPAQLETGNERNLAFYARHGFKVTGEMRLPAGPQVWLMRREPR
jgi:ribosomal protein S18 acetylase RimI-like enzyme